MNFLVLLALSFALLNFGSVLALTVRKYVYQKDMSEHCRRRVVPSVFLGKHVVEAHSQVLDFSKMELPYSCFISVRAESGNNIVLVVQLLSEASLVSACSEGANQLLVYDMSETFGGYWGPLPDSIVKDRPPPMATSPYTLKTTQPTTMPAETETSTTVIETLSATVRGKSEEEQDFVRVEVPIVDVSGSLVDAEDGEPQEPFDPDVAFDLLYDVTPRRKGQYRTSILPVVQFAIRKQDGRRGEEPRFDLEYEAPTYTADARLTIPRYAVKTTRWQPLRTNYYVNKLLNYKYTTTSLRSTEKSLNYKSTIFSEYSIASHSDFEEPLQSTKANLSVSTHNWDKINNILRNLSKTTLDADKYRNEDKNILSLLETVANMKHNQSAYLIPEWTSLVDHNQSNYINVTPHFKTFTRKPLKLFTLSPKNMHQFRRIMGPPEILVKEVKTDKINSLTMINNTGVEPSMTTTYLKDNYNQTLLSNATTARPITWNSYKSDEQVTETFKATIKENNKTSSVIKENATKYEKRVTESAKTTAMKVFTMSNITTPKAELKAATYESNLPSLGSTVGHKSWENVVQAAPVMAVMLNKSSKISTEIINNTSDSSINKNLRKKRKIEVIPIENARPHTLTTRSSTTITTTSSFEFSDMADFAQLVELQDDEFHERVPLRYLRQYVGPTMFNICESTEPKSKHVYLFNSTRVIMAINNFTLQRMTVMLTPARTLVGAGARCPPDSLECQVYGTRICIDNMNACDGVPNCGAYDIYDEDRLTCGAAEGLQHNVYLAAVTFLALLLTLMYTVHYWLKRCVPKVSEAFFIYTDGSENILYLETIMRSPHDTYDTMSKIAYHEHFPDDVYLYSDYADAAKKNIVQRIMRACMNCCKIKKKKKTSLDIEDDTFNVNQEPRPIFTFAEHELNKMKYHREMTEVAVQTGGSLEMSEINVFPSEDTMHKQSSPPATMFQRRQAKISISPESTDTNIQDHVNELNMLKFFKDVKPEARPSTSRSVTKKTATHHHSTEEKELGTHIYEPHALHERQSSPKHKPKRANTTARARSVARPSTSKQTKKRLRFDEEAISIPYDYEDEEMDPEPSVLLEGKKRDRDSNRSEEGHSTSGMVRDFRFWKSKKSKKKTYPSYR